MEDHMLLYEPEMLENKIQQMFSFLEDYNIDYYYNSEGLMLIDSNNDYDVENFEEDFDEDLILTGDECISIILPRTEHEEEITINELIDIVENAEKGKIIDNYKFENKNMTLIRVQSYDYEKLEVFDNYHGIEKLSHTVLYKDIKYDISIDINVTEFGLRIVIDDEFSKYLPPLLDEYFIKISSKETINNCDVEEIYNAFIFEVYSTFGIEFDILPRPKIEHLELNNYYESIGTTEDGEEEFYPNIRKLELGNGLDELYKLYNSTIAIPNPEAQILYFSKVIEYVSQTVINKELINTTLNKLSTREALNPGADFVIELSSIFDKNKSYKKDYEAYNITINTCCDIFSIKKYAPTYLKKLSEIDIYSDQQKLLNAYVELSKAISDTRNQIAHAKTNYNRKGMECPENELEEFSLMMKVISEQIVRWFARQPETDRIVG